MRKIVDLSGMIETDMWGYYSLPGLENLVPPVKVETIATISEHEFFASKIELTTVSGTYLEAGSHILEGAKNLDEYEVSDFVKPVKILRVPPQEPRALIHRKTFEENAPPIDPGEALLIDTGWWRRWNQPGYVLDSPNFSPEALQWILEQQIGLLAVDVTVIEGVWTEEAEEPGSDSEKGSLLGALFESGALMVAPVVNLGEVTGDQGTLICLPMKVKGTSGAPARVVFISE